MAPTPGTSSIERAKPEGAKPGQSREALYHKRLNKLLDENSSLSGEREMWKNRAFWGLVMGGMGFSLASILCTRLDGWAGGVLFGVMAVYCGYAAYRAA